MDDFTATTEEKDGVLIFRAQGPVEHANVASFIDQVHRVVETTAPLVVVNLRDVSFLSSVGWGTLLSAVHALKKKSSRLVLCELQGSVRSSYDLLGIRMNLPMYATEADALASAEP